jgi:hypothetical protein
MVSLLQIVAVTFVFRDIDHNLVTIFSYSWQLHGLEDLFLSSGEDGSSHIHEREEGLCVSHGFFFLLLLIQGKSMV